MVNYLSMLEGKLSRAIENLVALLFFFIFLLTVTLVVLRYGFNSSIIWGNEAMNFMFIYTTALGAAVSIGKKAHIRIAVFTDLLPPRPLRVTNIINYSLVGFFNGLMVWYSLPWIKSTGLFETPVMRIPNCVVQLSVPVGCSLAVLYCLNHIVLELVGAKNPETADS